jgi:general secretion pathway protein M
MKQKWLALKKQYWDARPPQEKTALKVGALILTPVLIYMLLWQPAHEATKKLHVSLPVLHMAEESLRSYANEIETLRNQAKPTPLDAAVLKTILQESAARNNLSEAITTLDLQPPNAVRISFAVVSFDQWLKWLRVLQLEQTARIDAMSVSKLPQAGMVKVSATLINGGKQ